MPSISQARLLEYVAASDIFRATTPADLQAIAPHLEPISLAVDDYLFHQGDHGDDGMYIVIDGHLHVSVAHQGGERMVVGEHRAGCIFGEISMLTGSRRTASVHAATPCNLVRISKAGFDRLAAKHPQVASQVSRIIRQRLQEPQLYAVLSNLLGETDLAAFQDIGAELEWVELSRGEQLIQQNAPTEHLFLLISGRLAAVTRDAAGHEQTVGEITPGESIGEMGLLTGEPTSASVYAVRDSLIAKFPHTAFERLGAKYPQIMRHITTVVIKRLQHSIRRTAVPKRSRDAGLDIVLVPASPDVALGDFTARLAEELGRSGPVLVLDSKHINSQIGIPGAAQMSVESTGNLRVVAWLNQQETEYRFILYQTDTTASNWTKRCLRQADQILLVANADAKPALSEIEIAFALQESQDLSIRRHLVLLHRDKPPVNTGRWLAKRKLTRHHHLRLDQPADFARLARFLTGRAVGLVLSGGSARSLAHIGVIQALQEAGVPIDCIGGTGMGALVAGGHALGLDPDTLLHKLIRATTPLEDFTFPLVSLLRGRRWVRQLHRITGDVCIEDLWLPCFYLSANLTRAELMVHSQGSLKLALTAGTMVPGLGPPVVCNGDLLADASMLNNLPVDVMRAFCDGGQVIAVDVSPPLDLVKNAAYNYEKGLSGWQLLAGKLLPFKPAFAFPHIGQIIMRAHQLYSVSHQRVLKDQADLYLQPPVENHGLFDYPAGPAIRTAGYEHALAVVSEWWKERE